jgi:K+-sensing histidine kinase KdpD
MKSALRTALERAHEEWRTRMQPASLPAYAAAAGLIGLASLIRWGLGFFGSALLPFTAYYPVVLFATYFGGLRVGIFATLLGAVVGWLAFMPPEFVFFFIPSGRELELATYLIACAFIVWCANTYRNLAHSYQETAERLQREERLRKLAVAELGHRLKNKTASILAIIRYQLREQPQLRDAISARLIALSSTDEHIMAAEGRGASIRAILRSEVGAYGASRVAMEGPDAILPPKLALTMALLLHELTTNAAKYGAFSNPAGKPRN